jgi:hypothetical protein
MYQKRQLNFSDVHFLRYVARHGLWRSALARDKCQILTTAANCLGQRGADRSPGSIRWRRKRELSSRVVASTKVELHLAANLMTPA